ncbi:MAG: hypothetical protein Kow0074_07870 [Candidatus Zixiibacteriota bacterium]
MPIARAFRLKYILDVQHKVGFKRIFMIYNVGQLLNQMFPALTGQVGRVVLFSRTLGITKTQSFTMVMLEVLFDGITLIMLIFGSSFLIVLPGWMVRGELVILLTCALLFGFLFWYLHRGLREPNPNSWIRRRLPKRVIQEWENVRHSFHDGLHMLKSGRHLAAVVLMSLLSWIFHALMVLFLLWSFGFNFALWVAIVVLIVNTLAVMIPLTPGNIGTFQFACIVGLGFFGVDKDKALGFSLLLHAVEVAPVFILGLISSFSSHVDVSEFRTPETIAEQERLARGMRGQSPDADECNSVNT